MYKTITECRACGSTDLKEVFSFDKPMPLANDFCPPGSERRGFVPVRVMFCANCTLAQLGETVDPSILYKNYLYVTSNSATMQRHFERLVKDLRSEGGTGSLVEIGSNDGAFLDYAKSKGFTSLLGIDPSENLADKSPIARLTEFFGPDTADLVKSIMPKVDIILARHVFCHQEWHPFMAGVTNMANPQTLVAIEVPYVVDLLAKAEFDTIYSEHTSYLTLKSVAALLKKYPFHIHSVLRYGIHGGCVMILLRHDACGIEPHLSAEEYLSQESITEKNWADFTKRSWGKIVRLKDLVLDLKNQGKVVSAFGASAKSSMLINACGFTQKHISFITDNSPLKPGRLCPGNNIPVIEEGEMLSQHPDYAIMTAWNFSAEICAKMSKWLDRGGVFIIPNEELTTISKNG